MVTRTYQQQTCALFLTTVGGSFDITSRRTCAFYNHQLNACHIATKCDIRTKRFWRRTRAIERGKARILPCSPTMTIGQLDHGNETSSSSTSKINANKYQDDGSRVVPVPLFIHGTSDESVRGVYAVLDETREVTYIGMSRDVAASLEAHMSHHGDDVCYVRVLTTDNDGNVENDEQMVRQMKRVMDVWLMDNEVTPIGNVENWYQVDEDLHKRASALSPIDVDIDEDDVIVSPFAQDRDRQQVDEDETYDPEMALKFTAENVTIVIDELIRPALQSHDGDISVVKVDQSSRTIELMLMGACVSCESMTTTMQLGVEKTLRRKFGPDTNVVAINGGDSNGSGHVNQVLMDDGDGSDVSIDMCEVALDSIRDVLHGLGAEVKVVEVDEDEVIVSYRGPHSLKFGIEQTLRDKVRGVTVVTFE